MTISPKEIPVAWTGEGMGDNAPPTPEVADNSAEATADADAEEDARQQINRP